MRKPVDCFDLARELFAYARHSCKGPCVCGLEKLKAQLDREIRRRAATRPTKRPLSDCFDLAREIYPYTVHQCRGEKCTCGYQELSDRLDQEYALRRKLFAKPISSTVLLRRLSRLQRRVLEDVAIEHNLIGFYERVES